MSILEITHFIDVKINLSFVFCKENYKAISILEPLNSHSLSENRILQSTTEQMKHVSTKYDSLKFYEQYYCQEKEET